MKEKNLAYLNVLFSQKKIFKNPFLCVLNSEGERVGCHLFIGNVYTDSVNW